MKKNLIIIVLFIFISAVVFMCSGVSGSDYNTATGKSPEKNIDKIGIPAEYVPFDYYVPDGMIEDEAEKRAMIEAKIAHLKSLSDSFWGPLTLNEENIDFAFETIWKGVDSKFIGFKNLDIDWDAVYDEYYPMLSDLSSYGQLAYILTKMAFLLEDVHAHFYPSKLGYKIVDENHKIKELDMSNVALPGAPVFIPDGLSKIGACHTLTDNNEVVILKVTDDMENPYNFQVGDEIVGVNGIPWSEWEPELENAGIPIWGTPASNPKSIEYLLTKSIGANVELFEKINIKRLGSDEIETLNVVYTYDRYYCTDIIELEGLKKENDLESKTVSVMEGLRGDNVMVSGFLPEKNIGYVILFECPAGFDDFDYSNGETWNPYETKFAKEFSDVILSFKDTDGIIIDLRYNIGGRNEPLYKAFGHLIKNPEDIPVYEDVERDPYAPDRTGIRLVADEGQNFSILAEENDLYYKNPVIVLTGPDCVSACDYTVAALSKFPDTFTIVGKNNNGSFSSITLDGTTTDITDEDYNIIDFVWKNIPFETGRFVDNPEQVLRTTDFIDIPLWYTKDDVINKNDNVIKLAYELIEGGQELIDEYKNNNGK